MSKTEVSGKQIKDGSIELVDLSATVSGDISTLKSDVSTLQSDVVAIQADVVEAQSDIDSIQATTPTTTYVDAEVSSVNSAVSALQGDVAALQTSVAGKASSGDVSAIDLRVAALEEDPTTKTYVDQQVAGLVNAAPAALDTLNELAAALGSDPNFATTVSTNIGAVAADVALVDARIADAEGDIALLQTDLASKASAASLATVATSGSYNDLADKPSLFSGSYVDLTNKPSFATVATSGAYSDLSGTPVLATVATSGSYNDLADKPTFSSDLNGLTDVTVTSPSNGQVLQYNGSAWVNGAAPSTFSGSYTDLTNKPTIPSALDDLSDVAVSSAVKGQFIAHNGTNFVNTRTIEADLGTTIPLTIKGASNHTNYLFVTKNSSDTHLVSIIGNGSTFMSVDSATVSNLTISRPASHERYGLLIRNSSGKRIFGVGANASLAAEPSGWSGTVELGNDDYQMVRLGYHTATGALRVLSATDTIQSWESPGGAAGVYHLALSRDTTAGTTSWKFTPSGFATNINFATKVGVNVSAEPGAQFQVNAGAAATKGMIVKGAASQSANLVEVQNSSGTVLASISSAGAANFASTITAVGAINFGISGSGMSLSAAGYNGISLGRSTSAGESGLALGSYVSCGANAMIIAWGGGGLGRQIVGLSSGEVGLGTATPGAQFHTVTKATTMKGLIVQGIASQTANLFEAQDSSGTTLFSIDKDGSVAAGTVPVARVSGLATVATSGSYNDLSDKPTGLATEAYVDSAVSALVASAPSTLDTLNELATALGNDANFSTTITNSLAAKADSSSLATVATSGSYNDLSDKPSIPSLTGYATESYVTTAISGKADSSSLATVATSGAYADLTGKPSLFDGAYSSLTGAPSLATVATSGSYNDLADKPTIPDSSKFSVGTSVDTTFGGITSKEVNAGATTSNATEATLWSLTLADNTTYTFDISVCARLDSTTAKGLYGKSRFTVYRNNAGSASFADDFGGQLEELDTYGTSGYDFVVDVSGNDVRIRVTGAASETVKWAANIRYVSVS